MEARRQTPLSFSLLLFSSLLSILLFPLSSLLLLPLFCLSPIKKIMPPSTEAVLVAELFFFEFYAVADLVQAQL